MARRLKLKQRQRSMYQSRFGQRPRMRRGRGRYKKFNQNLGYRPGQYGFLKPSYRDGGYQRDYDSYSGSSYDPFSTGVKTAAGYAAGKALYDTFSASNLRDPMGQAVTTFGDIAGGIAGKSPWIIPGLVGAKVAYDYGGPVLNAAYHGGRKVGGYIGAGLGSAWSGIKKAAYAPVGGASALAQHVQSNPWSGLFSVDNFLNG